MLRKPPKRQTPRYSAPPVELKRWSSPLLQRGVTRPTWGRLHTLSRRCRPTHRPAERCQPKWEPNPTGT